MDWKKAIGERIRQERKRRDLTLEQLADRTGMSFSRISNYEQGTRKPQPQTVKVLAEALDVDPAYLACYSDDPTPRSGLGRLSEDERRLVEKYRETDKRGKLQIHSIAESQPAYLAGINDSREEETG